MMFRISVPGFRRVGLPVPEGGSELIWFPPSILSVQDVGMGRDIFRTDPAGIDGELHNASMPFLCWADWEQPVKILFFG